MCVWGGGWRGTNRGLKSTGAVLINWYNCFTKLTCTKYILLSFIIPVYFRAPLVSGWPEFQDIFLEAFLTPQFIQEH